MAPSLADGVVAVCSSLGLDGSDVANNILSNDCKLVKALLRGETIHPPSLADGVVAVCSSLGLDGTDSSSVGFLRCTA